MKIALLISGGLGLTILQQIAITQHDLVAVFTNKKSTSIIDFCKKNKISYFADNPRKGAAKDFIKDINCNILLSVNYLYIVEKDLIKLPTEYAINIHGSLLPKYRGRTPHVWAIINGEKQAGITAHLMTEGVDEGDVLEQLHVAIDEDDTGADILKKYNHLYPQLVEQILTKATNQTLLATPQDNSKATFFGKRTPADGRIDWSWNKERIRNWIRAQAQPYPGAFAFYKKQKVVIHRCDFTEYGFHYNYPDGQIRAVENASILVKTTNGVLRLSEIENFTSHQFNVSSILN